MIEFVKLIQTTYSSLSRKIEVYKITLMLLLSNKWKNIGKR